jgi:hypothetical protein
MAYENMSDRSAKYMNEPMIARNTTNPAIFCFRVFGVLGPKPTISVAPETYTSANPCDRGATSIKYCAT